VPHATVRTDLDETLDVHLHFLAQITLNAAFPVDHLTHAADFLFGQVLHARARVDLRGRQNLIRTRYADTVDIGQRNFDALIKAQVHTRNTGHRKLLLRTIPETGRWR